MNLHIKHFLFISLIAASIVTTVFYAQINTMDMKGDKHIAARVVSKTAAPIQVPSTNDQSVNQSSINAQQKRNNVKKILKYPIKVAGTLYASRNNHHYQILELKPQTFHGLVSRSAWLDTRPGVTDTPCLRLAIFPSFKYMHTLDHEHLFTLVIRLGQDAIRLTSYTMFNTFPGKWSKMVSHWKMKEFILIFPLKEVLANHSVNDLSTESTLQVKQFNVTYPIEIKVIRAQVPEKQENFFVCVNMLYGSYAREKEDYFIEWVEFYRLMGVREIHLYNSSWQVSNRMKTILQIYDSQGLVFIHQYHTPFYYNKPTGHYHRADIENLFAKISTNECFWRNAHRFQYMVSADLDEILVPKDASDYNSLMADILSKHPASASFLCPWRFYLLSFSPTKHSSSTTNKLVTMKYRTFENPRSNITSNNKAFISTELCGFSRVHNCVNPINRTTVTVLCTTNHYRNTRKYTAITSKQIDTDILRFEDALSQQVNAIKNAIKNSTGKMTP